MIKLIASDLDGTLLQNGAQALTPRAIDLISRLCDAGIHFVSASGRQYDNQKRVFAPLKDRISSVSYTHLVYYDSVHLFDRFIFQGLYVSASCRSKCQK